MSGSCPAYVRLSSGLFGGVSGVRPEHVRPPLSGRLSGWCPVTLCCHPRDLACSRACEGTAALVSWGSRRGCMDLVQSAS